ncbi:MAG: hypothetical protein ACXWJ6_08450, partial [Xanthobacteraceae bacterium]
MNIFAHEFYRLGKLSRREEIDAFYQGQLRDGKTPLIVDCGSNVGLSLLYFSLQYPHAKIIGVEPDAGNFAKSVALTKQRPSVQVINAGIASAVHASRSAWGASSGCACRVPLPPLKGVRCVRESSAFRKSKYS